MYKEIARYAKIMYEKDFLYGLNGSISTRFEDDSFIINKKQIYKEENTYFTKLLLNENYKYNDACKDAKIHSLIYNNFPQAKVISIVCSKDILKICQKSSLTLRDYQIFVENNSIVNNKDLLINKLNNNKLNCLLVQNLGLVAFSRDFDSLFSLVFDIDLNAKLCL